MYEEKEADMSDKHQEQQINIELTEEVAEGIYSNLAIVSHSNAEFILDFIKIMPGIPKGKVKSRIILTPQHAKKLMHIMQENIARFEAQHGDITDINDAPPGIPMNFGGPVGMA